MQLLFGCACLEETLHVICERVLLAVRYSQRRGARVCACRSLHSLCGGTGLLCVGAAPHAPFPEVCTRLHGVLLVWSLNFPSDRFVTLFPTQRGNTPLCAYGGQRSAVPSSATNRRALRHSAHAPPCGWVGDRRSDAPYPTRACLLRLLFVNFSFSLAIHPTPPSLLL